MLLDLFKAFDDIESSNKSGIFTRKDPFSFMRAQHVMSYHLIYVPWPIYTNIATQLFIGQKFVENKLDPD